MGKPSGLLLLYLGLTSVEPKSKYCEAVEELDVDAQKRPYVPPWWRLPLAQPRRPDNITERGRLRRALEGKAMQRRVKP